MMNRIVSFIFLLIFLISCSTKKFNSTASEHQRIKTPDTISGFYKTETDTQNDDECELSVGIVKTKNGYSYHLKTNSRNVKGKIRFDYGASKEVFLIFEGIKWDENQATFNNEQDENQANNKTNSEPLPTYVEALMGKDTLIIQNTGNSMNYYVKIAECDRKFIYLVKQKKR